MGCSSSAIGPSSKLRRDIVLDTFRATLDDWRVTREESGVLYDVFDTADSSRDGYMRQAEFMTMLGLRRSAFTQRIFGLFDANANAEVDFGEFVAMSWSYMSPSVYSLIALSFALYSGVAASGGAGGPAERRDTITADDVQAVVAELLEDPNFDTSMLADAALDRVTVGSKRHLLITPERFALFALKHPAVLYPALRVQESFRQKVGGTHFWSAVSLRRAGETGAAAARNFA